MSELKFKYLNEIDISSSLTDSAHVIVEDGGSIKRAPMNQLVVEGGVSSWNDLKDKPFGEEGTGATIEWDGNTEGRDSFIIEDTGVTYYKVSDMTPSKNELLGGTMTAFISGNSTEYILNDEGYMFVEGDNYLVVADLVFVVSEANLIVGGVPVSIPSTGVYFGMADGLGYATKLTYGSTTIHTLDEKFIPDTIARVSDIPEGSAQINPDWNQNDPAQPDYVKNRTHWVEGSKEVLLDANVTMVSCEDPTFRQSEISSVPNLVEGNSYTIAIDGVETSITAQKGELFGADVTYIGDIAIVSMTAPAGGVNFCYLVSDSFPTSMFVLYNNTADTILLKICHDATTYHPLDEAFIPNTVARKTDVTWENLPDKPFYDEQTVIEWDGNTEGLESAAAFTTLYKMSGATPTQAELTGGVLGAVDPDNNNEYIEVELTDEKFASVSDFECINCLFVGQFIVAYDTEISFMGTEYTLPSTGIWVMDIFRKLTYGSTKTIDPKLLPKAAAVPNAAGEAPTAAEFNALLAALREAGYLAT